MIYTDCKICNESFKDQRATIRHIKKFHKEFETYEQYIIKFYYDGKRPTCYCGCGIELVFESHSNPDFYGKYTTNHWPHKKHTAKTKELIKVNSKKALVEKYGVDNPMKVQEFIDKIGETKEKVYGDKNYNNPEKTKQTNLEVHGVEYPQQNEVIKEKTRSNNFKKYNAAAFIATPEGQAQAKQTKKERYGDEKFVNFEKSKQTKLEKYGYESEFLNPEWRNIHNSTESTIQLKVCSDLGIEKFRFGGFEFDGKLNEYLIEVDGEAYHPKNLNLMSLTQMNSSQNDFRKRRVVEESEMTLLKVHAKPMKDIKRKITLEDVITHSYEQDFTFDYQTKFMSKQYLKKLIAKDRDNLGEYLWAFLKFIRTFQPTFPNIPTTESVSDVIEKIRKYDVSKLQRDGTFSGNCSLVGVSYLKSNFHSYWKSSYKNSPSPIEAWNDDKIMKRVIKYRIGLNNSNEVFDFSIHQMIRGLSAQRLTVSFFRPILAASIYNHFLGDVENPVVFDPCCGFGGRMLGFKSRYPNGTYIGCEPNPETFSELMELSKHFTNVQLHNCKLEDFDLTSLPPNLDLSFTSIPYFDWETYSNPVEYSGFEDWKSSFIGKLKQCPKLIVNIPLDLEELFPQPKERFTITSNTSHFNKSTNSKHEILIKL